MPRCKIDHDARLAHAILLICHLLFVIFCVPPVYHVAAFYVRSIASDEEGPEIRLI